MNKKEFIQSNIMIAYERLLKEETLTAGNALTMSIAVKQLETAWFQLSDLGYGGKTHITISGDPGGTLVQRKATINVDPIILLDDGKHQNQSVEYWTKKLKEAQGNPNFDHRDQTEIRTALTSAEVSKSMGFGYYKE